MIDLTQALQELAAKLETILAIGLGVIAFVSYVVLSRSEHKLAQAHTNHREGRAK